MIQPRCHFVMVHLRITATNEIELAANEERSRVVHFTNIIWICEQVLDYILIFIAITPPIGSVWVVLKNLALHVQIGSSNRQVSAVWAISLRILEIILASSNSWSANKHRLSSHTSKIFYGISYHSFLSQLAKSSVQNIQVAASTLLTCPIYILCIENVEKSLS